MTNANAYARLDIARDITDRLLAALEAGAPPWKQPWRSLSPLLPLRANGAPYSGINVLILWDRAVEKGYHNPRWLSFKQAGALGGQVRNGERSVGVVYYGTMTKRDEAADSDNAERAIRFLKQYAVFNALQIDGLPGEFYRIAGADCASTPPASQRQAFFDRIGAAVRHGGDKAFYDPVSDHIQMPPFGAFDDPDTDYATLAHEATHWTGHRARLDRLHLPFTSETRASEELVAEIGAAMLGATLNLRPDHIENHAAYVGSWLKALRGDKTYILKAAAAAQRAADFLAEAARKD